MSKKCPKCGNIDCSIAQAEHHGELWMTCVICGQTSMESKFLPPSVFDRITASPEVLAKELVTLDCDSLWFAWVGIGRREAFSTREKAIAATVKKLKEVAE